MKSKILLGCFALILGSIPLPSLADIVVNGSNLPSKVVLPSDFKFPVNTIVEQDQTKTSSTPITDQNLSVSDWGQKITNCLVSQSPKLIRASDKSPVTINNKQGTIVLNANKTPVCATN